MKKKTFIRIRDGLLGAINHAHLNHRISANVDLKELIAMIRNEERERCIAALLRMRPEAACKTANIPGEDGLAWIEPRIRAAVYAG